MLFKIRKEDVCVGILSDATALNHLWSVSPMFVAWLDNVMEMCIAGLSGLDDHGRRRERQKAKSAFGFFVMAVWSACGRQLPGLDLDDWNCRLKDVGSYDLQYERLFGRFGHRESQDFEKRLNQKLGETDSMIAPFLMLAMNGILDNLEKYIEGRLVVSDRDTGFAMMVEGDPVDILEHLYQSSPEFFLWMTEKYTVAVDETCRASGRVFGEELTMVTETLNFFFKAIWSANGGKTIRVRTADFLPYVRQERSFADIDLQMGRYFDVHESFHFLVELNDQLRRLDHYVHNQLLMIIVAALESITKGRCQASSSLC